MKVDRRKVVMNFLRIVSNIYKKPKRVFKFLFFDTKDFAAQSYYKQENHKSTNRIIFEQVMHIIKYGDVCEDYFFYGFDVSGHNMGGYVSSYLKFKTVRDYLNLSNSFNSSCILRNKFYFGVYANAIGINTPQNVA